MTHQRGFPDILTSSMKFQMGMIWDTPGRPALLTVIHMLTIISSTIAR